MAPLGQQAGLAASVIGTVNTLGSIIVGALIGHFYAHSLWALAIGYAIIGALAWLLMRSASQRQDRMDREHGA
jgi:membrane-associated PAP2 superfamily phosphatase